MENKQEQQPVAAEPVQPTMTGVRKRQQIQDTNKKIFMWLAVSSVIVSICLVALQFLVREFMFNLDIIGKKSETNNQLIHNIEEAEKLRDNVKALLANERLNALKYEAPNTETTALNVILDALPVEGDATAFANSLQAVVLPRSGVAIRELNTSAELLAGSPADPNMMGAPSETGVMPLPFTAGFGGSYDAVQQALTDMSKVIRPINLNEMTLRAVGTDSLQVTIGGVTYYLPERTVELRNEELKP